MRIFAALFFAVLSRTVAQTPEVPHKMDFAGMTLTIRDDARREIQKDVDALTQSPKHYNIKADRARMYFPLIEQVFREEQLPDDFKYLALQESALIADAVSTSNAVGFWQFKDFTAIEMGLRVDKEVDERLNIVSSSRAAARYLKKNNTFFDNWLYALQAYQMGAGGVMRSVNDTKAGARHMEITSKTYWYVKKYLAHKIAYAPGSVGKPQTNLVTYETRSGKSLRQIAKEVQVDEELLLSFNKWTKSGWIPADRNYVVVIPVPGERTGEVLAAAETLNTSTVPSPSGAFSGVKLALNKKRINGVLAVEAASGETASKLAGRASVDLSKFLKWNDLASDQTLKAGHFYFLSSKRGRATENFHKLSAGEDLWTISQQYGVKLRKLERFNRTSSVPPVGTLIYLASRKPKSVKSVGEIERAVAVSEADTFEWGVSVEAKEKENSDTVETKRHIVPVSDEPIAQKTSSDSVASHVVPLRNNVDSMTVVTETTVAGSSGSPGSVTEENFPIEVTIPIEENVRPSLSSASGEHVVAPKETLYAIAKMYSISVMELVEWNDLNLQHGIKIGQVLRVQPKSEIKTSTAERESEGTVHEVKPSDTLFGIARQYGVTIKQLMDWNEKKDFSISVGEKLKVYQSR